MDTKVAGSVVIERKSGNLPLEFVTFYTDEKPAVTPLEGKRVSFLRFKTDKKAGTRRENMAVQVAILDADAFTSKSQHDFLNALIADYQDSVLNVIADSSAVEGLKFEVASDIDKMIADFNDKSRDSNGRSMTKEKIAEWFVDACGPYVTTRALQKNAQMSAETLTKLVTDYAAMFGRLTKFDLANIYSKQQFELVNRILANCQEDTSEMREWINGKVKKIADAMNAVDALVDAI